MLTQAVRGWRRRGPKTRADTTRRAVAHFHWLESAELVGSMAARGERRPRAHNMLEVLLRERGDCFDSPDGSDEDDENAAAFLLAASQHLSQSAPHLLVVFDMDHTMVGDLVSLSDRDNVETNMPWSW